jgi:hypothetical protein
MKRRTPRASRAEKNRWRKTTVIQSLKEYGRQACVPGFGELLAAFPGTRDDLRARNTRPARALRADEF